MLSHRKHKMDEVIVELTEEQKDEWCRQLMIEVAKLQQSFINEGCREPLGPYPDNRATIVNKLIAESGE